MSIEVIKPGLASSIQDKGREGKYHLGIPPSGGMDQRSLIAANLLLGNPEGAAVIECALMGPELRFNEARKVVACGAEMTPRVNGEARPLNEVFEVPADATLSFDFVKAGARLYLAIEGGIDVPERLGSRSTYTLGSLGGLNGRNLQAGLYAHRLMPESHALFYEEDWSVASEADRIGYRMKGGSPLNFVEREPPFGAGDDPSNIVDACYPIGSIQVPSGSEPIILHRDAVSGGGYAMIGTVISADMDTVGQIQPHQKVRFVEVSLEEALAARVSYQQELERLRQMP